MGQRVGSPQHRGGASSEPPAQTISGVVIDGPIQGAIVCLDLNSNGSCDTGEPVSTPTDAQGHYTIADVTAAQLSSGAPWLAVIPATAIDADAPRVPVGKAYALWAPSGKPLVISPVTHLVQLAVSQGMTLATAEATLATQLQVQAASLYNNYVGATGGDGRQAVSSPHRGESR